MKDAPSNGTNITTRGSSSLPPPPSVDDDVDDKAPEPHPHAGARPSVDDDIINKAPEPHPHAGAHDENGRKGYIADPKALFKGLIEFHNQRRSEMIPKEHVLGEGVTLAEAETEAGTVGAGDLYNASLYWDRMQHYDAHLADEEQWLTPDYTCKMGPGRGWEDEGGYKILTEKIQLMTRTFLNSSPFSAFNKQITGPKILCGMYTYPRMRHLARAQALTWGWECDGFLAFSTETIPSLGILHLLHQGEESYENMWQKTRSIWAYIHDNYLDQYDYFHLGGDDMYLLLPHMRRFLAQQDNSTPAFYGQWKQLPTGTPKISYYVTGGPGYTLNRLALRRLVRDAFPVCQVHVARSYEDRLVSKCFDDLGIKGSDTRDIETGEQQYHGCSPHHLYTFRSSNHRRASFHSKAAVFWETLQHPRIHNQTVGPKHELQAAAKYSTTLHDLYTPAFVARIHAIVHPYMCPPDSPLARGLRAHYAALD